MTNVEKARLAKEWIVTMEYYGRATSEDTVAMYVEDLADLELGQVLSAMTSYRRNPKNRTAPLPAQIRDVVAPVTDESTIEADAAKDAASRIMAAIGKFGWPNPREARGYIGELGWLVVERQGGWDNVCRLADENPSSMQAQWRELAGTLQRRSRSGNLNTAPALPEPCAKVIALSQLKEMPK